DARDLPSLYRFLRLGRLKAVLTRGCDGSVNVAAHECQAPTSGALARRPDNFDHRLFQLEERLAHPVPNFADTLARDSDGFVRRDGVLEHGRHYDDVLQEVH